MAFTNESSYYNLFDPAKKYFEIRALAGYVEQSREDNEIQAILKDIVKRLGNTIWKQGELISGGGYTRGSDGASVNQLTFNEARVYIDGIVHDVEPKVVPISGIGSEEVGIKLIESLVTPSNDPSLRDPAVGFANYGQPGANRLKLEAEWTLKSSVSPSESFFPAYRFEGGVEFIQPRIGEIDIVTQQLARRTYDESGNYVVAGFDISVQPKGPDQFNIKVGNKDSIGSSKAYVQGYEVIKIADEFKTVSKAVGTSEVIDEAKLFELDSLLQTSNPPESKLKGGSLVLDVQPAAAIKRVTARFDAIQLITGHVVDGVDLINRGVGESNIQVIKVFSGPSDDPGNTGPGYVTYINAGSSSGAGDYFATSTGINWSLSGAEPAGGSSYYVYYALTKSLVIGEDCELAEDGSLDLSRLALKNTNGDGWIQLAGRKVAVFPFGFNRATNLSQSSEIDVDYDYFLPRYDVVYLDETGEIKIETGEYADRPFIPFVSSAKLSLGNLYYPAGADYDKVQVTQYNVRRLTMGELRKLYDRLERAEFNQGILDLNAEASRRVGNEITSLSGILTEAFAYTDVEIQNPVVNGVTRIKFNKEKTSEKIFNVVYREMSVPQKDRNIPINWSAAAKENLLFSNTTSLALAPIASGAAPRIRALDATETLQVNQFDFPKDKAVLTLGTSELPSESNEQVISVLNPNAPLIISAQTNINATESINRAGIIESFNYGTFISQQWVWCKGSGFKANEAVDLKVGGQAVELTTSTLVAGDVTEAVKPVPAAPSVSGGFLGLQTGDSSGIYTAGSRILTNTDGEFVVAFKTPEGLTSGNTVVQAESENRVVAAAIISGKAMITFRQESTSFDASALVQSILPDPVLIPARLTADNPVLFFTSSNAPSAENRDKIQAGSEASTPAFTFIPDNNLTGSNQHVYALINWQVNAGQPTVIQVRHTPLVSGGIASTRVFTVELGSPSRDYLGPRSGLVYVGQVNQAFEYQVTINNDALNPSSIRGLIRKDNALPTTLIAGVTSSVVVNLNGSPTSRSVNPGAALNFIVTGANAYNTLHYVYGNLRSAPAGIPIVSGATSNFSVGLAPSSGSGAIYLELRNTSTGAAELIIVGFSVPQPVRRSDPIAQTFRVNSDDTNKKGMFVRGARVFFSQVPSTSKLSDYIYAYLTPVVNGYPAPYESHIVMSKTLLPKDFVGKTSSNGTIGVDFEFLNAAYLEPDKSYALVLYTPSKDYRVFVGKIGGNLLRNAAGAVSSVTRKDLQSIGDGVLFEGATKETWVAKPEYDLTFELLDVSEFQKTGSITFSIDANKAEDVSVNSMVGFNLDARQFIPFTSPGQVNNDYSIIWEYKLPTTSWRSFQPQNYVFVGQTTSTITVRATFVSKDGILSPVLQPSNISVVGVFRETAGVYESNVATYSQAYNKVRMIGKMNIPVGTTVTWAVSDNTSINVSAIPTWVAANSYNVGDIVVHSTLYYRAQVSITGNVSNLNPSVDVSRWEKVEVEPFGRVWRDLIPVATTTPNSIGFREYEQTLELSPDSNRKQFLFKIRCNAVSAALATPPRVRDIITIVNT
jgi:hypothetical protein